jgi:hypothetical protein
MLRPSERSDALLRGRGSANYYGSLHDIDEESATSDELRGKSVSMLTTSADDDENALTARMLEACDADNWPGFCLCECDIQCAPPCCTVRRPLRCAGICFLILSLLEAIGIFVVGLAIVTTEWNHISSNKTEFIQIPKQSSDSGLGATTLINQACSNAIMAMYAALCFAVFSVQSIRDESKIQLASACAFSILVVLFVALHLSSDRFGQIWIEVRLLVLIASSICSAGVLLLAIPVSTTFGWVAYKTLRNADPVTQGVFQRYNHWVDAAAMDFSLWVLVVLSGGAFDIGFNLILSTTALCISLVWWRLGALAARNQWSTVFSCLYLPLSICLPSYAGYVAYEFYESEQTFLAGMSPINFLTLVGLGIVMRVLLVVVGYKMRYHSRWKDTRDVLRRIRDTLR